VADALKMFGQHVLQHPPHKLAAAHPVRDSTRTAWFGSQPLKVTLGLRRQVPVLSRGERAPSGGGWPGRTGDARPVRQTSALYRRA
jgi:hypothetical protein